MEIYETDICVEGLRSACDVTNLDIWTQALLSTTSTLGSIKEALPSSQLPSTEDTILADAATRTANKTQALALTIDETSQQNHHERKVERK